VWTWTWHFRTLLSHHSYTASHSNDKSVYMTLQHTLISLIPHHIVMTRVSTWVRLWTSVNMNMTLQHTLISHTTSHSDDKSVYMSTALNQCEYEHDTSEHSYHSYTTSHSNDKRVSTWIRLWSVNMNATLQNTLITLIPHHTVMTRECLHEYGFEPVWIWMWHFRTLLSVLYRITQ